MSNLGAFMLVSLGFENRLLVLSLDCSVGSADSGLMLLLLLMKVSINVQDVSMNC